MKDEDCHFWNLVDLYNTYKGHPEDITSDNESGVLSEQSVSQLTKTDGVDDTEYDAPETLIQHIRSVVRVSANPKGL